MRQQPERCAGRARSLFGVLLLISTAGAASARADVQAQRDWEAALAHALSSAPSYILITVVDGRSGRERTGCTLAPFLLGAMLRERGLPASRETVAEVQHLAQASLDHRFVFREPAALAYIDMERENPGRDEACRMIASGQAAFMADRTGETVAGYPPGHEPAPEADAARSPPHTP